MLSEVCLVENQTFVWIWRVSELSFPQSSGRWPQKCYDACFLGFAGGDGGPSKLLEHRLATQIDRVAATLFKF